MARLGALFLHGAAGGVMAHGFRSLQSLPTNDFILSQKGGHFQFLTIQGLAVAWLTMVISLGCDILPSVAVLRVAKRATLMIALPLAIVISAVYWSLILYFPTLILQAQHQSAASEPSSSQTAPELVWIPLDVDLCLHVAPVVTLLADFFFYEKKYAKKQVQIGAPLVILVCCLSYTSWIEYCAGYNGTFPYPFLTENPLEIRIGIYTFVSFLAWSCFWLVNAVHP